jgi:hypothetical protein
MRRCSRMLIAAGLAGSALGVRAAAAGAQASQRGQPRTAFAVADFSKLRWLEGTWAGTSEGGRDIFERWRFTSDTTIEITYYADSTFSHEAGSGRLYLSVGRIYHTMGPGRWGATHVDERGAYFVPQVNANNTFAWSHQSNDEWTATQRSGFAGHDRVTVYRMRRARP